MQSPVEMEAFEGAYEIGGEQIHELGTEQATAGIHELAMSALGKTKGD